MTGDAKRATRAESVEKLLELISSTSQNAYITNGSNNNAEVEINTLRMMPFLLLFSGLDISDTDISTVERVYRGTNNYQILWIPIVKEQSWTSSQVETYRDVRSKMPWYTVRCSQPTPPNGFNGKPRVMLMNSQGKLLSRDGKKNAFPKIKEYGVSALQYYT